MCNEYYKKTDLLLTIQVFWNIVSWKFSRKMILKLVYGRAWRTVGCVWEVYFPAEGRSTDPKNNGSPSRKTHLRVSLAGSCPLRKETLCTSSGKSTRTGTRGSTSAAWASSPSPMWR